MLNFVQFLLVFVGVAPLVGCSRADLRSVHLKVSSCLLCSFLVILYTYVKLLTSSICSCSLSTMWITLLLCISPSFFILTTQALFPSVKFNSIQPYFTAASRPLDRPPQPLLCTHERNFWPVPTLLPTSVTQRICSFGL